MEAFQEHFADEDDELSGSADDRPQGCDVWFAKILTISLVCRRWRDVLRDAPAVWDRINTDDPPSFIHTALKRSQTRPLKIAGPLTMKSKGVAQQEATLAICSHVARWTEVYLEGNSAADFDLLTYPPAPALESLGLNSDPPFSTPLNIFNGTAPVLKELSLWGCPIRWTSPILSGLQALTLEDMDGPTASGLLEILGACPALRELSLHKLRLAPSRNISPTLSTISLPDLKTLSLRGSLELYHVVLRRVHCSAVDDLSFSLLNVPSGRGAEVMEAAQVIGGFAVDFLRRWTINGEDVELSTEANKYTFSREDGESPFTIALSFAKNSIIAKPMMDAISQGVVFSRIRLQIDKSSALAVWTYLNQFPSISSVKVGDAPEFLGFLETRRNVDGTLHWNLPNLKRVEMEKGSCSSGEEVLKRVQSRKGRAEPAFNAAKQLPSPFESLAISEDCSMDKITFMKLKTILPEAEVTWKGGAQTSE